MKNIKIPELLLRQAIDVMERFDISEYGLEFQHDFDTVLFTFLKKQQSMELREAYSQIINAEDDDARHVARMRYLKGKRDIVDSDF